MEPGRQGVAVADGAGPKCQREERCLEGVVGVGGRPQGPAADAQDRRPVPADDGLQGRRVAGPITVEQGGVRQGLGGQPGQAGDGSNGVGHRELRSEDRSSPFQDGGSANFLSGTRTMNRANR